MFGTSLSQRQVDGCEALIDECLEVGADLGQAAYILARAYGETGGKMQPVEENLFYTSASRVAQVFRSHRRQGRSPQELARNPQLLANTVYGGEWGRIHLGNTQPTDGWDFRGRSLGQITGRRNYTKWSQRLGLPLVTNPDLLMQLDVAVKALVRPMMEGWATGKALPDFVEGDRRDYAGANSTWNGTLDVQKYVGYAKGFEGALEEAGYTVRAPSERPERPLEPPAAKVPSPSIWGSIAALLPTLFGRSK